MTPVQVSVQRMVVVLASGLLLAFQGCVSYEETGVIHPDGSGEVRIAIGMPRDNVDPDRVAEVRSAVKRLKGVQWISGIDSGAGKRRWIGGTVHFDSVEALRPLNTILPIEDLFGGIRLDVTDSGTLLRRNVKLPPGSKEEGDFTHITWRVPGTIVATDKRGHIDSSGSGVRWNLPLPEGDLETATTTVRWKKKPLLPQPAWMDRVPWLQCIPAIDPWLLGLQVVNLVLMALALVLTLRVKSLVREHVRRMRHNR